MAQTADHTHSASCALSYGGERAGNRATGVQRLRVLIFQEAPGLWVARGLEHDLVAEDRSIGTAVRAVLRLVQAHTAFDARHDHQPLSAFRPAPQNYWNAYSTGTPLPLEQLGVMSSPVQWEIQAAVAHSRPWEGRGRRDLNRPA